MGWKCVGPFFIFLFLFFFQAPSQAKGECVAVVPGGWHHQFWRFLVQGAHDAALDYNAEFLFRAPSKEGSSTAQRHIVQMLIDEKKCHAFVIAPMNAGLNDDVAHIVELGGRAVYVDRDTERESQVNAVIMTDNYNAGKRAAKELSKQIPAGGTLGILRLHKGVTSTDARERGFVDMAQEMGFKISLDEYLGETTGEAMRAANRLIPQILNMDGLFTPNESTTQGVLIALSRYSSSSQRPIHVGFDMSSEIEEGIVQGTLYGTIVQSPYEMGYQGVKMVLQDHNLTSRRQIFTPIFFATQQNISDYSLKQKNKNDREVGD